MTFSLRWHVLNTSCFPRGNVRLNLGDSRNCYTVTFKPMTTSRFDLLRVGGGPVEDSNLIVFIPSSPEIEAFYPHSEKVTFTHALSDLDSELCSPFATSRREVCICVCCARHRSFQIVLLKRTRKKLPPVCHEFSPICPPPKGLHGGK